MGNQSDLHAYLVIPAKTGTQLTLPFQTLQERSGIPAYAGMTEETWLAKHASP